jgi:hypothetical protein
MERIRAPCAKETHHRLQSFPERRHEGVRGRAESSGDKDVREIFPTLCESEDREYQHSRVEYMVITRVHYLGGLSISEGMMFSSEAWMPRAGSFAWMENLPALSLVNERP